MKNNNNTSGNFSWACIVLLLSILVDARPAASFSVPEKLQYDLTWAGIKTGEAALEVKDNGSHIQLISTANTAKWVSVFHKVEDVVISLLKKETRSGFHGNFIGTPYSYKIKLREGRYRRDKEIVLDHAAKKATYINHLKGEKAEFTIGDLTMDPLSCFYYIRTLPLEVGKSVYVEVFDSKKLYRAEVQVLKKETIETPAGTFKTILIKPIIKSAGIFSNRRGDLFIWLSDDNKKMPVLVKTKAAIGSVKAALTGGQY